MNLAYVVINLVSQIIMIPIVITLASNMEGNTMGLVLVFIVYAALSFIIAFRLKPPSIHKR